MTLTYTLLLLICVSIIAFLIFQPKLIRYRRNKSKYNEFPKEWDELLTAQWPLYHRLPELLKQNLKERIKMFLAEKTFIGSGGFVINDQHKILIAAQACLLIVNKPFEYYDKLSSILIYPSAFIVKRPEVLANGTVSEQKKINLGEAWGNGKIVLSWDDSYSGMINASDGQNVVIHEFAHLLDQTNGSPNGAPFLAHAKNYKRWSQIFAIAFERLQKSTHHGKKTLFNPYGETNPAEFFAVVSEIFFEQSDLFQQQEPALHEELVKFYGVDPVLWRN